MNDDDFFSNEPEQRAEDRLFLLYERPVLNPVNFVWVNQIRDQIKKRHLRVMLSGSAGNHTLSYAGMEWLSELLASGRLIELGGHMFGLRRFGLRYGTILAQTFGPFLPQFLWQAITIARGKGRRLSDYSLVKLDSRTLRDIRQRAMEHEVDLSYRARRDPVGTRLWALRRIDPGNYNKGTLAGWGIDERDPTADRRLIEFCLNVPAAEYIKGGIPRALVRSAMASRLPAEVVNERRRGIQAADWTTGVGASQRALLGELDRMEHSPGVGECVDLERLRAVFADWPSQAGLAKQPQLYRVALMRALAAGHFLRKAKGSN